MNLILLSEEELENGLPDDDPRARHIRGILRKSPAESFDVGLINGPRGKARIAATTDGRLRLSVTLQEAPPPLYPLLLCVGLSRPQTVRRLLRDCTAMGVGGFVFFSTDRGEAGYGESRLWDSGELGRLLIDGAQQGFSTLLPAVQRQESLGDCLAMVAEEGHDALALDNYEAPVSLVGLLRRRIDTGDQRAPLQSSRVKTALFVGAERGWSAGERERFRSAGVPLVHLGDRVLRTDVAAITAAAVTLSTLGFYERGFGSSDSEGSGEEE